MAGAMKHLANPHCQTNKAWQVWVKRDTLLDLLYVTGWLDEQCISPWYPFFGQMSYVRVQNLCIILVACTIGVAIFRRLHGMKASSQSCIWLMRHWMSGILYHYMMGVICSKSCCEQKDTLCSHHKCTHYYILCVPTNIPLPVQIKLHVGLFLSLCVCLCMFASIIYCICMFLHFLWYVCAHVFCTL